MNLNFLNQTALIIGGANGIGRAIAQAFRDEGASLAIADIAPNLETSAGELGAVSVKIDVTAADAGLVALKALPNIDHFVYAAGIGSGHFGFPFWNVPAESWAKTLEINLVGAFRLACAFAPGMSERRRGTMLFISSVAGQMGSQTDPPYSAAKAGLINFSQCAAKDLAPYGVRVNTICPGMIPTALNRSVWQAWADRQSPETWLSYEAWTDEKIRRVVPLGRWQTAEDVASLAVFLASERAANITGQTLNVDGGFVMHS
jgi:2-hydroxycyclohexanecarboxyl-CoA dehydrogenase